ncbi:unnamed protein product [Rotaria sordida]|nr:unnamed protein product [Rotaria sordida]
MCHLAIEHVNQLEKHKRVLPAFILSKEKRMFDKALDGMIQLITLVASHQPGIIKYELPSNSSGTELSIFLFPRSFSIDNYVRLFFILYETYNLKIIEEIMDIVFNHLQKTSTTVETILIYGFLLLIQAEHYQNKQQQEKIQQFACKIIK